MFIDHYYKFHDRESMLLALEPLGMTYTTDEGETVVSQGGHQYAAWVDIPGYEGRYQVTKDGRVKSFAKYKR